MLRPFAGQSVAALLSQGFLGHVLGILQPLGLHADVVHELGIAAIFLGEDLFHAADSLPGDDAEPFAPPHKVQQLDGGVGVAEVQL